MRKGRPAVNLRAAFRMSLIALAATVSVVLAAAVLPASAAALSGAADLSATFERSVGLPDSSDSLTGSSLDPASQSAVSRPQPWGDEDEEDPDARPARGAAAWAHGGHRCVHPVTLWLAAARPFLIPFETGPPAA